MTYMKLPNYLDFLVIWSSKLDGHRDRASPVSRGTRRRGTGTQGLRGPHARQTASELRLRLDVRLRDSVVVVDYRQI